MITLLLIFTLKQCPVEVICEFTFRASLLEAIVRVQIANRETIIKYHVMIKREYQINGR